MSRAAAGESSPGRQHVVNELPNSAVWAHSPPREEGWTRHQEDGAKPPLMERTGWSLTRHLSENMIEPRRVSDRRVSDHPVCGAAVGFAGVFLMPQPPLLTRRGFASHLRLFVQNPC